jgi:hypothetical protein
LKTIQSSDYISRSITTHGQMRRLPHQGARHSTVDHANASDGVFLLLRGCLGRASMSSSTCGCFLRVERSLSQMISLLSFLSSLWTAFWVNGLSLRKRLHVLRVASSSRSRNGGPNHLGNGLGQPAWADRPRPIPARFGHSLAPVGPLDIMHFAPSLAPF